MSNEKGRTRPGKETRPISAGGSTVSHPVAAPPSQASSHTPSVPPTTAAHDVDASRPHGLYYALTNTIYNFESIEYCHLTFEVSLFALAFLHLLVQEYNLYKSNLYAWEYTGLCISIVALVRRLLLKVVQSAKMHQDAQEELWIRRVLDAQQSTTNIPSNASGQSAGGTVNHDSFNNSSFGGNSNNTPTVGKNGKNGGKNKIPPSVQPEANTLADPSKPGVPQIRAITQRRQQMESKSRRRLYFTGVALAVLHLIGALSVFLLFKTKGAILGTIALLPTLVYLIVLRITSSWSETTPSSPTTMVNLGVTSRRQLACTVFTTLTFTFYTCVLPLILVPSQGFYSKPRVGFTVFSSFINTFVLLMVQSMYKGVPMFATARMHALMTHEAKIKGTESGGGFGAMNNHQDQECPLHPAENHGYDAYPPRRVQSTVLESIILACYCKRPDAIHRLLLSTQLLLIMVQTYVCFYTVAWLTHILMLLASYVVLHHCQQCRHDLVSSPLMNALLNHNATSNVNHQVSGANSNVPPLESQTTAL
eukprot:PhF_6_TR19647/c0_g1_i1/m.28668